MAATTNPPTPRSPDPPPPSPQVFHDLVNLSSLSLVVGESILSASNTKAILLLVESVLLPCYYHHCFPGVMSQSEQFIFYQDLCLSPYIVTNGSVPNQSSAGKCLQLENVTSFLLSSVVLSKCEWILFSICSKLCSSGAGFRVYYRDLFSETLLLLALPLWFHCEQVTGNIRCRVFYHWLSQQSLVVNW